MKCNNNNQNGYKAVDESLLYPRFPDIPQQTELVRALRDILNLKEHNIDMKRNGPQASTL